MSDHTTYTLCYAKGAVVAIYPGSVARTGCQRFVGTMDEINAQIAALHLTPLPDPALVAAKTVKIDALGRTLAQPVTVSGIRLAVDADTQTQINHLVTLLQLAQSQQPDAAHVTAFLGTNVSTLTGPILDAAGSGHDMTVQQAYQLVLGYGQAYGAARASYLSAVAAVNAAATVADVQAVG